MGKQQKELPVPNISATVERIGVSSVGETKTRGKYSLQEPSSLSKCNYKVWMEVAVLSLLITIVWALLSLPVVFNYIPKSKVRLKIKCSQGLLVCCSRWVINFNTSVVYKLSCGDHNLFMVPFPYPNRNIY